MADVASGSSMLGLLFLGMFGRGTEARTPPVPDLSDVCGKGGAEIRATDLPVGMALGRAEP